MCYRYFLNHMVTSLLPIPLWQLDTKLKQNKHRMDLKFCYISFSPSAHTFNNHNSLGTVITRDSYSTCRKLFRKHFLNEVLMSVVCAAFYLYNSSANPKYYTTYCTNHRKYWYKHMIIRTSWLYGMEGHNFMKTMGKL